MLLDKINSPVDVRQLPIEQLPQLAGEIRQRMVEVVSNTGGHLASSLGAVELAIALHYCLNTPEDKILWDVGHQSYAHKILTGRNKNFTTLRQLDGISGFCCSEESECDPFTSGHSSNAISQGLGLVCAGDITGENKGRKVVAVVGDGALSGGLCFEGLNNAGHLKKDILVVLNTNELSISPNVGAISTYLNKIISLPIYNRFRDSLENFIKTRMPHSGKRLLGLANKFEEGLKNLFVPGVLFEELGFRYFGPFDGHDLATLVPSLRKILSLKGPILMHVITKKGKGYLPAENDPVRFHSASAFDMQTGQAKQKKMQATYTGVFSEAIVDLARDNTKIVAITAAMPEGTGLDRFRDLYPQRFFDVGIAEAHAVCFAAGLARANLRPVVAIYSTFLQRAYDQIIEEVALQKLPVVFVVDRAGIVGEDGVTHQGLFDITYLRSIPNMIVMAPKNGDELKQMLKFALDSDKPCAVRYPRSACPSMILPDTKIDLARPQVLKEGEGVAIIALGSMVEPAWEALEILKTKGITPSLINARFIKPFDLQYLLSLLKGIRKIFVLEEGIIEGGFGSGLMEKFNKHNISGFDIHLIGLPQEFIPHGRRSELLSKYGLDAAGIAKKISESM